MSYKTHEMHSELGFVRDIILKQLGGLSAFSGLLFIEDCA